MTFRSFIDRLFQRSDIIVNGEPYMRRWAIISTRWFGIRLHHILTSDPDPVLHDHPFSFISIIMTGGYSEEFRRRRTTIDGRFAYYQGLERTHHPFTSVVVRRLGVMHRVLMAPGRTAWTICFRGPQTQPWGFLVHGRWVHFKEFVSDHHAVVTNSKGEWASPDSKP